MFKFCYQSGCLNEERIKWIGCKTMQPPLPPLLLTRLCPGLVAKLPARQVACSRFLRLLLLPEWCKSSHVCVCVCVCVLMCVAYMSLKMLQIDRSANRLQQLQTNCIRALVCLLEPKLQIWMKKKLALVIGECITLIQNISKIYIFEWSENKLEFNVSRKKADQTPIENIPTDMWNVNAVKGIAYKGKILIE